MTTTFEKIEEELKEKPALSIKKYRHNENKTLEEFIWDFLKNLSKGHQTYFKEDGKKQCKRHANRSAGDIYKICLEYYPDTKIADLYRIFKKLHSESKISIFKCPDIGKFVFVSRPNPYWSGLNNSIDEYSNSWEDINKQLEENET